jgi:hypothetical protein
LGGFARKENIMEIKVFHADENADGINDHISIRNMDFGNEPLIGDYRGIELCRINYIPSRPDSIFRAEQIAHIIAAQLRVQLTESGRASDLVELVAAFGN